jgi:hypothetical protein
MVSFDRFIENIEKKKLHHSHYKFYWLLTITRCYDILTLHFSTNNGFLRIICHIINGVVSEHIQFSSKVSLLH